jgi:hypothetical protein
LAYGDHQNGTAFVVIATPNQSTASPFELLRYLREILNLRIGTPSFVNLMRYLIFEVRIVVNDPVPDSSHYPEEEKAYDRHLSQRCRRRDEESIRNACDYRKDKQDQKPQDASPGTKERGSAHLNECPDRLHEEKKEKGRNENERTPP